MQSIENGDGMSVDHGELVERMAALRQFIEAGRAFLRRGPAPSDATRRIAQAIQAAEVEHDLTRSDAIRVRPADWIPG